MIWVDRGWETLKALSAGAPRCPGRSSPPPTRSSCPTWGTTDTPPPAPLCKVDDADEAKSIVDQVLRAIERMLFLNVVHGDLSAYNLLVWDGLVTVIDLPQAVDPRKNRHAKAFLDRDVERAV